MHSLQNTILYNLIAVIRFEILINLANAPPMHLSFSRSLLFLKDQICKFYIYKTFFL